ncbi:hypothetical protein IF2G_10727 [Cordyceps javanica]|nr:hypothetical protein IF2G_10727 [Cordyceps javanica]
MFLEDLLAQFKLPRAIDFVRLPTKTIKQGRCCSGSRNVFMSLEGRSLISTSDCSRCLESLIHSVCLQLVITILTG